MILGVVLAGGQSRRFGSDKALAELDGRTLLVHAVERLSGWCDHVVVAGRAEAPAPTLPDWPRPGLGPLGGLAAALRLARDQGYDAVFSCGVDCAGLPENLPALLIPGPTFVMDQPVIGLWPVSVGEAVELILQQTDPRGHSLKALVAATKARAVALPTPTANINTPADLEAYRQASR